MDAPFGLALPFSWAVLVVKDVAACVVTAAGARVVNDTTAPNDFPSALEAITVNV